MQLIYIDEAGNTGRNIKDASQPIHLIGALIIEDQILQHFSEALDKIARWCSQEFKKIGKLVSANEIEFHGSEISGGRKIFRDLRPETRIELCEHILTLCEKLKISYMSVSINKACLLNEAKYQHPHIICFRKIFQSLNSYLKLEKSLGLLVADECQEIEMMCLNWVNTVRARDRYALTAERFSKKNRHERRKRIKKNPELKGFLEKFKDKELLSEQIIDSVHFIKSSQNRIIQACDILTYFRLKHYLLLRKRKVLLQEKGSQKEVFKQFDLTSFQLGERTRALDKLNLHIDK